MRLSACLAVALLTLGTVPSLVHAQSFEIGDHLRISHHCRAAYSERPPHTGMICRTTTGVLTAVAADTVYLSGPKGAVPRDAIGRVELRIRQGHLRRGAITGGFAGIALVVAASAMSASRGGDTGVGLPYVLGSPLGFALGAFVGASVAGGDEWREVPLEALDRSMPGPGGAERR